MVPWLGSEVFALDTPGAKLNYGVNKVRFPNPVRVGKRVRAGKPAVLCSHGPVLPEILTEIALATGTMKGSYLGSASALEVGAFSVVHLSSTNPGSGIVSIETHVPKA